MSTSLLVVSTSIRPGEEEASTEEVRRMTTPTTGMSVRRRTRDSSIVDQRVECCFKECWSERAVAA